MIAIFWTSDFLNLLIVGHALLAWPRIFCFTKKKSHLRFREKNRKQQKLEAFWMFAPELDNGKVVWKWQELQPRLGDQKPDVEGCFSCFLDKVHLFCSQVWKKKQWWSTKHVLNIFKSIGKYEYFFYKKKYYFCCHVNWLRVRILYIFNRPANLGKIGFRVRSSDRWVDPPRSCERYRFLIPKVCPWLVGLL